MLSRITRASQFRTTIFAAGWALLLPSCSETAMSGPHAQTSPAESEHFFAAAVEHFVRGSAVPVRVDPRPLQPGALLHSVSESDILVADRETTRLRTAVLSASEIPLADATADWRCAFATGLRGPGAGQPGGSDPIWQQIRDAEPDSVRVRREACRREGEFVSLAFGLPQAGTDPEHPQWWRIRAMRMMLHGWEVVDLFLEPRAGGEWSVVNVQERVGSFS
jgi:hypothetical protein